MSTDTLRTLLARLQGATERDDDLERDLLATLGPMQPKEFQRPTQRIASWASVLDVIAVLPDLTQADRQAIHAGARGDNPPGYVLAASLLRFLIEREGRE